MSNRITDPNDLIQIVTSDANAQLGNAEALVVPDERWTIGHDLPDASGAFSLEVSDTCDPADDSQLVAGTVGASPLMYTVKSFGAVVGADRPIRCANGEEEQIVRALLDDGGIDAAAEYALWNGIPGWDPNTQPYLNNVDVQTVGVSATPADTLAAAIQKRSQLTVSKRYIVHIGIKTALDLSSTGQVYLDGPDPIKNSLRIRAVDAPVVVSPYYPVSGIAITGPVIVRVTGPTSYQQWDYSLNKTAIRGFRLLEIDFDPSTAVRAV